MSSPFSPSEHRRSFSRSRFHELAIGLVLSASLMMLPALVSGQTAEQPVRGYVMKRWRTVDGLPHDTLLSLLQTRDGYLWIGTTRAGLVRFDGLTFTTFNAANTPALGADWIGALHEDADGTLWIGTEAGLVRYRDGVFTPESLGGDTAPTEIADIEVDRDGKLWAAGPRRVVRRDGDRWTVIATEAGAVHPLSPSSDGTMWIATSKGLVEWRDRVVRTLTTSDGLPSDVVFAVHEDRNGRVWIGTNRGLAHLDRRHASARVERTILSNVPVAALFEDNAGVLWIGGVGRLFARAPNGALSEAIFGSEGEQTEIRAFTEDREGHIWFGTAGGTGGLHRLSRERVTSLAHQQGLPCDNIGPITEAADGTIWLATLCTDGTGVVAIRDGRLTSYAGPTYVESLLAEPDGTVWVGTFDGTLFRLQSGRFVEVPSPAREGKAGVAVIYRHTDGSLWLGTTRGLFRSQTGQWTRLQSSDGLVNDDVRSIVGDRHGALWIGTAAGVSRYHEGRFTSYRVDDGVPTGLARALYIDADDAVWIGTYGGGLARLKGGALHAFGVNGGALDRSVHRILEDEQGFLWLTGDRGIRRVSKTALNAAADGRAVTLDVMLLTEVDGLPSVECNGMGQPAGGRMRNGTFYFPTQRGVALVDPVRALDSARPPPVAHIEEALADGVSLPLGAEVVVPAGYRDVEIRYTSPTFERPEQVQFRYRLEGYRGDWADIGTRRLVSLANLKPGRYRFLVAARHGGGAWSEQPAAVTLVLQPLFYQRLLFQIAMGLLAIALVAAGGRWYVHGLRRRSAELERAVAARTADLSVAHQRLSVANEGLIKAKGEVEQAHGQVLAVFRQLDIGVLVLNADGAVRHASASAQRMLRKGEPELVGHPWSGCLPLVDADRAQVKARIAAISASGGRLPVQMVIGGTRYWAEIDVREEPPPGDGRILYFYDVTEMSARHADGGVEGTHGLIGRSTAMHLVLKQIRDVARVESTVLIQGETGVGKELVARAIHRDSLRAGKPFVAVNAAGLSESLLASQLFGHRRGSFTGAVDDQRGVFEAANGGTLFLDEIGDMPANMQTSLLRVLQEREITRIGESHARAVDVRFIAATHRDLKREVEEARFREDLLYRIRVATIAVPPLRERLDDVPVLVDAFLAQASRERKRPAPRMSRDAIDALLRHDWPGNVRELKAVLERSLLRATGDVIRVDDLPPEVVDGREAPPPLEPLAAGASERDRVIAALRQSGGNRKEAARLLGIGRTTLYRRLIEYGLDREQ